MNKSRRKFESWKFGEITFSGVGLAQSASKQLNTTRDCKNGVGHRDLGKSGVKQVYPGHGGVLHWDSLQFTVVSHDTGQWTREAEYWHLPPVSDPRRHCSADLRRPHGGILRPAHWRFRVRGQWWPSGVVPGGVFSTRAVLLLALVPVGDSHHWPVFVHVRRCRDATPSAVRGRLRAGVVAGVGGPGRVLDSLRGWDSYPWCLPTRDVSCDQRAPWGPRILLVLHGLHRFVFLHFLDHASSLWTRMLGVFLSFVTRRCIYWKASNFQLIQKLTCLAFCNHWGQCHLYGHFPPASHLLQTEKPALCLNVPEWLVVKTHRDDFWVPGRVCCVNCGDRKFG